MKSHALNISVLFLLQLCAWAETKETECHLLAVPSNDIQLEPVLQGRQAVAAIVVENITKHPVAISAVKTGCSCAVADKPASPLLPGQNASITVKVNTTRLTGRVKENVIIIAEASGERQTIPVTVTVNVSENGKLSPDVAAVYLGRVQPGDEVRKDIIFRTIGEAAPTSITKISTPNWLKATYKTENDSVGAWRVELTGIIPGAIGRLVQTIRVNTDSDNFPVVEIPLLAHIESDITAEPSNAIVFVDTGAVEAQAKIRICDKRGVKIERIELIEKGESKPYQVSILPGETDYVFFVSIKLDRDNLPDGISIWSKKVKVISQGKEYTLPLNATFLRTSASPINDK